MSKNNNIARNIREIRKAKGISQDKLSKLSNLAFPTITKIESGNTPNPTISTIKKIADALHIGVDDLLKDSK